MIMIKYVNGNTNVELFDDGTKIRTYAGNPAPEFPESIDVKITDFCDQCCPYCHEQSDSMGNHGDLDRLFNVISELPAGVEMAIGGGNPLAHPNLVKLLIKLKDSGFISNITVNQNHLYKDMKLIDNLINQKLVYGIGVSIVNNNFGNIRFSDNMVFHLIAGISDIRIIDELLKLSTKIPKILVLGYKRFGRGSDYYNVSVEENINIWYRNISRYIGKCILCFDNLAIAQLNIRRLFTDRGWDLFYMGDDFQFSMYLDAVKGQYATSSRSSDRVNFDDCSLIEFFNGEHFL